ncbi:DUF305 domain-containing protein [Ornithinibacter aureus]|uniref:DUF305 domain-containing protein n=1 Tax=Ornithinibacter aureus TaxID=622664 RepID=A0ABP8K4R1_9MICO|nr:DUF305 domain-containing protein [Ornithinibacter aureus]KAF0834855.1 uncharacterized protein (DUF305 family) [Ornithinibacter aureus]
MRLTSRLAIPAASAVLILALSACGSGDDSHSTMSGAGTTSSSTAEGATTSATGDVEFAQMMIPHHEQAVEMADLALASDTASPEVKALAGQIKAAQDPEIQTMKGWLAQWGASESAGQMDHGGMMSDEDMSSLMGISGPEFNQMWLTMMIEHHEGAVEMAQDVLATTSNPEVEKLATAVVQGQEKEITTMKGMLG